MDVVADPDSIKNFHLDLHIDFTASILENRYFTLMDCILELSSFAYLLVILAGFMAAGRLYDSFSLNVA